MRSSGRAHLLAIPMVPAAPPWKLAIEGGGLAAGPFRLSSSPLRLLPMDH